MAHIPVTAPTDAATVGSVFQATLAAHHDRPALRSSDGEIAWTWGEYGQLVRQAAAGLSDLGLRRGDTVACWLTNRPEFHVADIAAIHLGAASFSIYPTFTIEQAEHVLADAGARILVTEAQFQRRAREIRDRGHTALEVVIVVDETADPEFVAWSELLDEGDVGFDLDAAMASVEPDDLLTLIYTSGTTGPPKGVQLTHRNVVAQVAAMSDRLLLPDGMSAISWLPMAHIAERLCTQYLPAFHGWSVTTCADARAITTVLADVRPEFFFAPPRLWEKLRAAVLAGAGGKVPAGADVPTAAEPADTLARLGFDRLRVAIVGAAPCAPEVIGFWHALGVQLGEVYGLSETTGVATINPPDAIRIGTVGPPLPDVEVRLADNGEVLIRGPVIMAGYRNQPDLTAETIDADGWLHSGDVGAFDDAGYLRIVDRIKEIIVNAAGKNMSPANIEAVLKTSGGLIGQACCIGDGRPFNVALITLDPDASAAFAARHGLTDAEPRTLAAHPAVQDDVAAAVARANDRLARVEQIKRFAVLPEDWAPDGDELTPTMKLKRKPIAIKYAAEIEALYTG